MILFTFLSPPNTFLSVCNTTFSLSSLVSISPLLPISFSLSFFLSLHLFVSAFLSLSLFFFLVTIFLSFFSCHEEGDSNLKQSSSIKARQSEVLLANLKLYSPKGSRRSLLVVLHSRRSLFFVLHSCHSLLVVLHSSRRRWLVEFGH